MKKPHALIGLFAAVGTVIGVFVAVFGLPYGRLNYSAFAGLYDTPVPSATPTPAPANIQMLVDCDTIAPGVQSSCTIDSDSVVAIPIDVVVRNVGGKPSQINSFNYDLFNPQCSSSNPPGATGCTTANTTNAAGGIGPGVPVVDATNFPPANYNCISPPPSANTQSGATGTSTSFLSCFNTAPPSLVVAGGTSARLSGESFSDNVTAGTTIVLTLSNAAVADDNFATTIACDPAAGPPASPEGNVSGPCFPAILCFTPGGSGTCAFPPTATPTITPTPPPTQTPTITPTPTKTPLPLGTCRQGHPEDPCNVGFWKGHMQFTDQFLPITLGEPGNPDCDVNKNNTRCPAPITITVDRDLEARNILEGCGSQDSSVRMTCQLLVTKLNIASGSGNPTCILPVVQQADSLLTRYGFHPLPAPSGAVRTLELDVAAQLEYWNRSSDGTCRP